MIAPRVEGFAAPRFARVRELLERHLAEGHDIGFGLSVYHRGQIVIDLVGGYADAERERPFTSVTLLPLTSITKCLLATVVLQLEADGVLGLEMPIAHLWPEFAAEGKASITVAEVLSHRAGIPFFPTPIRLADELAWTPIADQIAGLRPMWTPGSAHGYHAVVLGFLLGELVRRATGARASAIVRDQIIRPLDIDIHMPIEGTAAARLAKVVPPAEDEAVPAHIPPDLCDYATGFRDPTSLLHRATFGSTAMTFEDMNNPDYYRTERPAAYGTARAVAKVFAALVSDVEGSSRLLPARSADIAGRELACGRDRVFCVPTRYGAGFMLPGGPLWADFGRPAFGHIGSTGALAFADPSAALGFAFLPSKMKSIFKVPDRRARALVGAVYEVLGEA